MTLKNYNTLFVIFLVITIILFIFLIVFFFVFDIRKIIGIKTGWAVKQSMKELKEINQKEDNRKRKKYKGHSVQLDVSQSSDLLGDDSGITNNGDGKTESESICREKVIAESAETVTVELGQGNEETTLLETSTESDSLREIEDSENELEEDFFSIFETKMIICSNEIITKQGIISEI